jgi:hypothetical protein
MSHYAKVENGIVTQVIVAEADFIATGALGDPAAWVQTSYNTRGNVHYDQNGVPDAEGTRGNYAGVGYTYDSQNDVFVAPQPSPDHTLDTDTWTWWNPTATDPVETKPVKAVIVPPLVEEVVPPLVTQADESVADVPAEAVVETPAETPAEPVVEVPAETTIETPAEVAPEEAPK